MNQRSHFLQMLCHSRSRGQSTDHFVSFNVIRCGDELMLKVETYSEQSCGNGIVENDEQCDPGSQDDPCCDRTTCRFVNGATCSPLNSLCCTSQCQTASSGTVCRPSIDQACDREEVCNGSSAECPADEFENDGASWLVRCLRVYLEPDLPSSLCVLQCRQELR